jgi:hypothetical protein
MYFRTDDDVEKSAYLAAYNQLLKHHGHDDSLSAHLTSMLTKALHDDDTEDLMNWYHIHSVYAKRS